MKPQQMKDWGEASSQIRLSPEQIIEWLEGYRELMMEIWRNNPKLREEWERLNE